MNKLDVIQELTDYHYDDIDIRKVVKFLNSITDNEFEHLDFRIIDRGLRTIRIKYGEFSALDFGLFMREYVDVYLNSLEIKPVKSLTEDRYIYYDPYYKKICTWSKNSHLGNSTLHLLVKHGYFYERGTSFERIRRHHETCK